MRHELRIRKQVYDLTPTDLARHPVWDFALDEEDRAGQDEATVRPAARWDPSDLGVVRARFITHDGRRYVGYVTPSSGGIDDRQPTVVTARGHVGFWFGDVPPKRPQIVRAYDVLHARAATLFPLRYVTDAPGARASGVITGFSAYRTTGNGVVVVC